MTYEARESIGANTCYIKKVLDQLRGEMTGSNVCACPGALCIRKLEVEESLQLRYTTTKRQDGLRIFRSVAEIGNCKEIYDAIFIELSAKRKERECERWESR